MRERDAPRESGKFTRTCRQCGKGLSKGQRKYCSKKCSATHWREKYLRMNPWKGKTSATTGAISELRVAVDLLTKGYNVFRALSPSCPCDLAILKDSQLLKVEVRTSHITTTGKIYRNISERDDPKNIDIYAWVLPNKIIYEPALP